MAGLSAGGSPRADGLSPADLIRGPEGTSVPAGDALLSLRTGASPRPGDLRESLEGSRSLDRDRKAALTAVCFPAPDILSPAPNDRPASAELSTPGLRCAGELRSVRPWITSGMVSAIPYCPSRNTQGRPVTTVNQYFRIPLQRCLPKSHVSPLNQSSHSPRANLPVSQRPPVHFVWCW
jgi:hypothetical protein